MDNINTESDSIKAVSPTPLVGAELLERIFALKRAGVFSSRDILICTGYYKEGDDYGQSNIDFFGAKLAATKEAGITMTSQEDEEEEPTKEDYIEELKTLLSEEKVGDIDLFHKACAYLVLDGTISAKVKEILSNFYNSIEPEYRYKDVLNKEEFCVIVEECLTEFVDKYRNIKDPYFDFLSLYFAIDRIKGEPDPINDWNTALVMMEFVKRHPEHPHLRTRFADFMTNSTESGMEHSYYLSFKSPIIDFIKEEHEVFTRLISDCQLADGNVIDNSKNDGVLADILDEPQTINNLKEIGYIVQPRTAEQIAEAAARIAKENERRAKIKAEQEAYQKEYDSVPKEQRELEDNFYTALDNCDFDKVFQEVEKYKTLILENIDELASNFTEEVPFEAAGTEPQWLLTALLKAGAEFGSGSGRDDDDDEILYEKQPVEQVVKQETKAPETGFTGKRVCITGKLGETREVWEAWVKDAGGTVASSVSKTTDYLIAGEDAGSKLAKAEELGVTVLNEEQAKEILDFICEEIQKNWAALIIDKLIKDLPTDATDGYFKIIAGGEWGEDIVLVDSSVADIKVWLEDRVGTNSEYQEYVDPEAVEKIKIEWVAADKTNNVTVWFYDEECGTLIEPSVLTFNTKEDALNFCQATNSDWGGHLSTLRVVTKQGETVINELGSEAGFPNWDYDYERIFHTYNEDPSLLKLVGGKERMQEIVDEKEYDVIQGIIRDGLWPTPSTPKNGPTNREVWIAQQTPSELL